MVNNHIITFQYFLKELETGTGRLREIMTQVLALATNLQETCTAIDQTLQNMKRDAEKI
jgi:hypothetical protein